MCLQKLKRFTILLLILFSLPLIIGQLPFPNNKVATEKKSSPISYLPQQMYQNRKQ